MRKMPLLVEFAILLGLTLLFTPPCSAQKEKWTVGSKIGVGVRLSLLGVGGEVATPLTRRSNLRGGFNLFSYSRRFDKDQVTYVGDLSFRSVEAHYDWFPFAGSFHLSPGVMVYNGNQVNATASVAPRQTFTLSSTTYFSDPANPVTGNGLIDFRKAAPTFLLGWGNLIPRRHGRHFSVPIEVGVVFTGSPRAALSLSGNVCNVNGTGCRSIGSDTTVQNNIKSEQDKINNNISALKVYPVISIGFGYKF